MNNYKHKGYNGWHRFRWVITLSLIYSSSVFSNGMDTPIEALIQPQPLPYGVFPSQLSTTVDKGELEKLKALTEEFWHTHKNIHLLRSLYILDKPDLAILKQQMGYASIDYPNVDHAQILVLSESGSINTFTLGDEHPFSDRKVKFRLPSFLVNQDSVSKLIVIQTVDTIHTSITIELRNQLAFDNHTQANYLLYGLFFGALIVLAIGSLFLLMYTREISFLWYSLYLFCSIIFLSTANGLGQAYLFPDLQSSTKISFIAASSMIITITVFASSFLSLSRTNILFLSISCINIIAVLSICVGLLFFHHGVFDGAFFALAVTQMVAILSISIYTYLRDRGLALFLILGYLVLFPALTATIFKFYGLISNNSLLIHSVEISFLIEAVIFSLGLGRKIQQLTQIEREAEQKIKEQRDQFLNNLIKAREHEKRDLSVVLHNSVAQLLALIRSRLIKIEKEHSRDDLKEVIGFAESAMNRVRNISHTTYPHALEQLGLSHAVKQYAQTHLDHREIDWQYTVDNTHLSEQERLLLYRILQECINNTVRHSMASKVVMELETKEGGRRLTVKDDGQGFDTKKIGFGLSTIKEYAEALGGVIRIESQPQSGSTIYIKF